MSLESEISARLLAFSALTAIVSTRIYNTLLPEAVALPAVAFQRISTAPRAAAMGADTGDVQARIQVDVYAPRGEQATAIAAAAQVRAALQRYVGGAIQYCAVEGELPDYITEAEMWCVSLDFMIWYKE